MTLGRLIFSLIAISPISASAVTIISTFDTDLDGWKKAAGDAGSTLTWMSSGENPGGYLRYNEAATGANDYLGAPAKFLGDMSAFIGGTLSLDRMTNSLTNPIVGTPDDIILFGGGLSLRIDLPNPGLNVWITESVNLTADGGWVRADTGLAPTPADFQTVLANLTDLRLRADFRSGAETPSYDNIAMTARELSAIPEPTSTLALGGLLAAGLCLRNRKSQH